MSVTKLASLSFALALVYSISLPARAELLKNFKTDGSIEVKSFGIDNEVDRNDATDDYRGETRTRIMVGGSFDLLDDVHSRVLLAKHNRIYGGGSENGNTIQSSVVADNAYVKIDKVFRRVDLTMGRQFYGDPNDILIYFGPQNDDVLSVTAVDLFRADADFMSWGKFRGIAGKIADTGATAVGASNSDTDLWGVEFALDKVIPKGNLSAGFYSREIKAPASATDNDNLYSVDLKATGDIPMVAGLGYSGQYVQNSGRNNAAGGAAHDGNAYLIGLHYGRQYATGQGAMPFRAHGEYGRGTGGATGFQSIAAGKRFGLIWGEHSSFAGAPSSLHGVGGAGLSNLIVLDAGVGITIPKTRVRADLNGYRFTYAQANFVTTTANNTDVGSEYDLILSYPYSDNVTFEASWASFQVGDALRNTGATPTNNITRLGSDIKIKF